MVKAKNIIVCVQPNVKNQHVFLQCHSHSTAVSRCTDGALPYPHVVMRPSTCSLKRCQLQAHSHTVTLKWGFHYRNPQSCSNYMLVFVE